MTPRNIQRERCIRFYRWALRDFQREIDENYPYLRAIQSVPAKAYLRTVEPLSRDEQLRLSVALVRRTHFAALEYLNESLAEEERALAQSIYVRGMSLYQPQVSKRILECEGDGCERVNTAKLGKAAVSALRPLLGDNLRRDHGANWNFVTPVGDWFVGTRIELTNKGGTVLAYRQNVMAHPDAYVGLAGSPDQSVTSILTWMGVGLTEYLAPFERDAASVVESLTAVCAHFLREIPSVLDGLSPPPRLVL